MSALARFAAFTGKCHNWESLVVLDHAWKQHTKTHVTNYETISHYNNIKTGHLINTTCRRYSIKNQINRQLVIWNKYIIKQFCVEINIGNQWTNKYKLNTLYRLVLSYCSIKHMIIRNVKGYISGSVEKAVPSIFCLYFCSKMFCSVHIVIEKKRNGEIFLCWASLQVSRKCYPLIESDGNMLNTSKWGPRIGRPNMLRGQGQLGHPCLHHSVCISCGGQWRVL